MRTNISEVPPCMLSLYFNKQADEPYCGDRRERVVKARLGREVMISKQHCDLSIDLVTIREKKFLSWLILCVILRLYFGFAHCDNNSAVRTHNPVEPHQKTAPIRVDVLSSEHNQVTQTTGKE